MHKPYAILIAFVSSLVFGQPEVVKHVDIARYAGKWYEIASFPQVFQKGCHCTTAEYGISPKGYVTVYNKCNKNSPDGKVSSIKGKAFPVKGSNNAKLQVQFFWPFKADYWIIDIDSVNYTYAVVGHPSRKYLWILSRTPNMDTQLYERLLKTAQAKGFDITKLQVTDQSCYL